ncbi:Ger(x)C family spore germination protein [Ammoniphilus sp. YIM 78166]|uniref:Ger(x)C family spore germination protein n=1 Tax=Ammoniphilus sp. YIM 78166 TaxID=1644106 RepID=UPI001F0DE50B|nr:Ger(x)C family spore germination protein [Ammoniphilus sp. YIM 78166]
MLFLSGCSDQTIINEIQMIDSIGYDKHEGKIIGTVIYPRFEEKGKVNLNMFHTESDSSQDILPRLNTKSDLPIEIGQVRLALFGKEFAIQGIDTVVKSFELNPKVTSRMQLAVAEPTAETILKSSLELNIPFHTAHKITQNMDNGNLPKMNLHLFLEYYYGEGRDPFLPYLIKEKNEIKIDGLALFKRGEYIHHINMKQSFLLKMLLDGTQNGVYKVKINENKTEGFILLKNLDAKARYTIGNIDPIPNITIHLSMNVKIQEVPTWVHLTDNKEVQKIEKIIEDHINKEILQLISLFQEYNVDPLGLGDRVRAKSRNWDYKHFQVIYPQLKKTVNTKVKIIQTGVGE